MVRTQIQLTDQQAEALKEMASRRKVSMSELVRQGVDRILDDQTEADQWRNALGIMGHFSDSKNDVSTDHDKYLEAAYD